MRMFQPRFILALEDDDSVVEELVGRIGQLHLRTQEIRREAEQLEDPLQRQVQLEDPQRRQVQSWKIPPLHIYGTHPSSNILGCLMPTNLISSNDIVNAMSDDKVWNITKQTGQTAHTLSL